MRSRPIVQPLSLPATRAGVDEAAGLRTDLAHLVIFRLVRMGLRVVVTSRPEGVSLNEFEAHFVIVDLQPLSDEQARSAVERQLDEQPEAKALFGELEATLAIRIEHDRIFCDAFPSPEERRRIEAFEAPNLLMVDDGRRDPSMRQRKLGDGLFVAVQRYGAPRSRFLQGLQGFFTASLLSAYDEALGVCSLSTDKSELQEVVSALPHPQIAELRERQRGGNLFELKEEPTVKLMGEAVALGLLVVKRRAQFDAEGTTVPHSVYKHLQRAAPHTTAAKLWPCIVARTGPAV